MLAKKENKSSSFKKAFIAFLLTYSFLLIFFSLSFLLLFKADLVDKNLDNLVLAEMFGITMATYSVSVVPISVFIFSLVYYREIIKTESTVLKNKIKKAILPLTGIMIITFLVTSFLTPKIALHQFMLLYEIRLKAPDEPLVRDTDENIFVGSRMCCNLFELTKRTDESNVEIEGTKNKAVDMILTIKDSVKWNQILESNNAKKIGITKADLTSRKTRKLEEDIVQNEALEGYVYRYLGKYNEKIEFERKQILQNKVEQFKMIVLPFVVIISYFIGLGLAILLAKRKRLVPFLICFYLIIFPGIYYLKNLIESLILRSY